MNTEHGLWIKCLRTEDITVTLTSKVDGEQFLGFIYNRFILYEISNL